eukprot:3665768-Pyramimonas_sp.AAC.1
MAGHTSAKLGEALGRVDGTFQAGVPPPAVKDRGGKARSVTLSESSQATGAMPCAQAPIRLQSLRRLLLTKRLY